MYVVDALAITGDEGRGSLRKAVGSWQTNFDPQNEETHLVKVALDEYIG